ncbi:uncharacterized protein [Neodiprion pinetum]|uniref:uncharacterized protein n=1 Tax=Neodiprion pinetum TaxID=441929 RepID=UPI001EDD37B4|nr:uncharacterized protein LOC124217266 [Neodiprion pinetum]
MSLNNKAALQQDRVDSLANIDQRLTPEALQAMSLEQAMAQLALVNRTVDRIEALHERIYEEHEEVLEHEYHTAQVYQRGATLYGSLQTRLEAKVNSLKAEATPRHADATQFFATGPSSTKLPHIKLPTFDGDYTKWRGFRDLFTTLIIDAEQLTGAQRMSYLKTQLKDDALALIANVPLTDEAFPAAWDLLVARYDNPRRLLNTYLEELLTTEPVPNHSAPQLNALVLQTQKIIDAMGTLRVSIADWDPILVFVTLRRLVPELREEWESTLGISNELPAYQKLQDFLIGKVRAWEISAIGVTSRPTSPKEDKASTSKLLKTSSKPPNTRSPSHSSKTASTPSGSTAQVYYTPKEATDEPGICQLCRQKHFILYCQQFKVASVAQRRTMVQDHRLCWNCLGRHRSQDCRTTTRCRHCGNKHHTAIHEESRANPQPTAASGSSGLNSLETIALLATATCRVYSTTGAPLTARLLIDQGSELSFMTNSLHKKLGLPLKSANVGLRAIGNTSAGRTLGSCTVELHSLYGKNSLKIQAHILSVLAVDLPSYTLIDKKWSHLLGLQLADPQFLQSRPIDIILGAAPAAFIMNEKIRKGPVDSPIAQSTLLGWIVYGSVNPTATKYSANSLHVSADEQLPDLISRFWDQEEPHDEQHIRYSEQEDECEAHFRSTHYRHPNGRYVVHLPLKDKVEALGNSLRSAQFSLRRVLKRMSTDTTYSDLYHNFMSEYENMGHMKHISMADLPEQHCFLPHHGVLKEQSTTTKLRVVFNGSCNTSSGVSLNGILHVGPKIQVDICDVLLRIRRFPILFGSDITKMFRQIDIDPKDWPLQSILWKTKDNSQQAYTLTTVTYGTTCAPYLAVRTLLQLVEDEGSKYPLAVAPMTETRYVDDIYGGADTETEAIAIAKQTRELCAAGCFPLTKWSSNSARLLATMSPNDQPVNSLREIGDTTVKVLGVGWNPHHDVFQFNYHLAEDPPATKRAILSEIARLYDPLGFLAPIIIKAKVIMQELWLEKLGWDDQLAPTQLHKWTVFRADLTNLANLRVNRWINLKENVSAELHGFSDASQLAMAAVVYLKVTDLQGNSSVALLCSKTQVAPLKPLTIPRLELNAAVLLTRLTLYVRKTLNLEQLPIYLWTDSAVTLAWIQSQPSRWKTYVRNRVAKIQDTLPGSRWTFIAGKSNPADCASRGLSVGKLLKHPLWWSGPKWLSLSQENWPTIEPPATTATHQEERPGLTFMTFAKTDSHPLQILLERFSRWVSLVRTLGICLRAISRMKKVPQSSLATPLSAGDLEPAKWLLVKYTQGQYFSSELKLLSDGGFLPKNHPLAKLTPFVDYHGILRVGGRLKNSLLDSQQKNPAILPRYSLLTSLLIDHAHKRNFHGGTQLTLAALRQSYWIIGGRVPVRSHILRCVVCARHRGVRAQQLMGQLPPSRVTPARAFLHTGLDYAGPVTLKTFQGRGAKTYKGWIAVFVCFTTSAIHLELVTDYSTGAFIAAYRRFASRRGVCHTIYSDCGTNFVGADATLRAEFASGSKSLGELSHLLATDGTTWKFNPPGAPHFGGKWEAAVKSIKFHLTRTIGEHLMTYEQLTTVLTQIEAVVNSRPLAPLSEDPADLEPLTPGHFLIGEPLTAVPEPSLPSTTESTLTGYKLLQQLLQQFWRRWSNEVLQRHQGISKWHRASNDIKVGSLVLLTDERFPPTKWPLARVIAIHPGKDGHTRVVTLKTATTELTRPIAKLCVLPIEDLDVSAVNPGENVQSTPKLPGRSEVRLTRSKKAALSRAQITRQSIANQ